jgi:hypothetical protein
MKKSFVQKYRGFEIWELGNGSFAYFIGDCLMRRCNTAWSCVVAIDERLSP